MSQSHHRERLDQVHTQCHSHTTERGSTRYTHNVTVTPQREAGPGTHTMSRSHHRERLDQVYTQCHSHTTERGWTRYTHNVTVTPQREAGPGTHTMSQSHHRERLDQVHTQCHGHTTERGWTRYTQCHSHTTERELDQVHTQCHSHTTERGWTRYTHNVTVTPQREAGPGTHTMSHHRERLDQVRTQCHSHTTERGWTRYAHNVAPQREAGPGTHNVTVTPQREAGPGTYTMSQSHHRERLDQVHTQCHIENVWMEIKLGSEPSDKTIVGCIYKHPGGSINNVKNFRHKIEHNLISINKENKQCLITGDVNIDGLKIKSNNEVENFFNMLLEHNFLPTITCPTRIVNNPELHISLIDHIIISSQIVKHSTKIQSGNIYSDISDHLPNFIIRSGDYA